MKQASIILILIALVSSAFAGNITITPTTTLSALKGNNTSASNTFTGLPNGNPAPGNVSKLPIRSLLYAGSNTRIYVHIQPWFGKSSHVNVGYNSADPAQVRKQVNDMISRGINGLIVDWYGPASTHNNAATLALLREAEQHSGFEFAITEDGGALKGATSPTAKLISDLKYAYQNFYSSPSYMRENGRPIVAFFSMDQYSIDWNKVRASVPGNPLFVFRNSGGFSKTQSNGAFSWVGIASTSTDMGLSYLSNFYNTSLNYPTKETFGSAYKGFNDSVASWGKGRKVNQQCGQTWLATFAHAAKYHSTSHQLESLQIATWNDYEEGTAIEMGIDNCVTVSAAMSGSTLNWSISGGKENTIDHYEIYISKDGTNLMKLAEYAVGNRSMNMSGYSLAAGKYYMYVRAVGKASIRNKISGAVTMTR